MKPPPVSPNHLSEAVGRKAERKPRARRRRAAGQSSVWFGLGLFGIVGWTVALPTVLGAPRGLWLDRSWPGRHSWTLTRLDLVNYFDIIGNMNKSTAIAVLGALAQDTRLEIFRHLAQTGPQPAGQVGERFGLPLATLSFHLKTLQQAGLLDCQRAGRQLIYQARCDVVTELMGYLMEHCCVVPSFQGLSSSAVSHNAQTQEFPLTMNPEKVRKLERPE